MSAYDITSENVGGGNLALHAIANRLIVALMAGNHRQRILSALPLLAKPIFLLHAPAELIFTPALLASHAMRS
jgi:hypothetical protein